MKIGILESSDFSINAIEKLEQFGIVELFNGFNLPEFLSDKEVLFVRLNHFIGEEILNKAQSLKCICSPTTGLNHIDLVECQKRNIKIISLKGETEFLRSIRATPEHTLGLIIALKRNYSKAFLNSENNHFNRDPYKGFEINASKIGIIGLGRVGQLLAKYLMAMDAEVHYYDIEEIETNMALVKSNSMNELILNCDTIVLCANYFPESKPIITKAELDLLKDKYFVNTARAELVEESYMAQLALKGHFKGLAVDVIQNEQASKSNLSDLLKSSENWNIIVTPHIGGATYTSMERTELFMVEKLREFIDA